MAKQHGRHTYMSVGGDDISAYTNASELDRGADEHDVTCYGADGHEWGDDPLQKGEGKASGIYDNTAVTGPGAVLRPLVGTIAEIIRRPEGTGSGKPVQTFDAFIKSYKESSPVADYVTWELSFNVSGVVTDSTQGP